VVDKVVLATGNAGKLREMRQLLADVGFEAVPQSAFGIEPPVEDGESFVDNALVKARHAARGSGLPAIADDSGLEVDALGGAPGVRSARYAGEGSSDEDNNDRLLADLSEVPPERRTARYRCAIVFVADAADPAPLVCEASWEGRIGTERQGSGGFGYDPLFLVAGSSGLTAAGMPDDEKNRVSHRGQALRALVAALSGRASGRT